MSNSSLVTYTKISPMKTHPRSNGIKKITIHHMAGNLSVQECGEVFQTREASANYGINGKEIGLYVDEYDRAWSTGSGANDHQAINIELANDEIGGEWHVSDETIETCIKLCVDICQRNKIKGINYTGAKDGNLTMHRWFMATACPGDYLASKFPYIAAEINKRLNGSTPEPAPTPAKDGFTVYIEKLPPRSYFLEGDGYDACVNFRPQIKEIQLFLNWALGTSLETDGNYGPATASAVERFQALVGIDQDGSWGKNTLAAALRFTK